MNGILNNLGMGEGSRERDRYWEWESEWVPAIDHAIKRGAPLSV